MLFDRLNILNMNIASNNTLGMLWIYEIPFIAIIDIHKYCNFPINITDINLKGV